MEEGVRIRGVTGAKREGGARLGDICWGQRGAGWCGSGGGWARQSRRRRRRRGDEREVGGGEAIMVSVAEDLDGLDVRGRAEFVDGKVIKGVGNGLKFDS